MPKKKSQKRVSSANYQHFKLHGNHQAEKVFLYVVVDLIMGIVLGVLLQPTIVNFITTHFSGY